MDPPEKRWVYFSKSEIRRQELGADKELSLLEVCRTHVCDSQADPEARPLGVGPAVMQM